MRVLFGISFVAGSLLAVTIPAQAQQCTVPNTLVNGQVADATEVMDNFNAVAACADDTKDNAVAHDGAPNAGEIAVFTSPTGVTGGDLTGDVTTSGSTATTLSATGVTAGIYSNPSITVDEKGRVIAAANGSASGNGGNWTLIYSNTAIANPTPHIDVDVTGYNDVMVMGRGITSSTSGYRTVQVSVDDGATFYKTTGDYETLPASGAPGANYVALNHNGRTTAARSFGGIIHGVSVMGAPKLMEHFMEVTNRWFVASYDPITHIRVAVLENSNFPDIPMTGGEVFVLAR